MIEVLLRTRTSATHPSDSKHYEYKRNLQVRMNCPTVLQSPVLVFRPRIQQYKFNDRQLTVKNRSLLDECCKLQQSLHPSFPVKKLCKNYKKVGDSFYPVKKTPCIVLSGLILVTSFTSIQQIPTRKMQQTKGKRDRNNRVKKTFRQDEKQCSAPHPLYANANSFGRHVHKANCT